MLTYFQILSPADSAVNLQQHGCQKSRQDSNVVLHCINTFFE